MNDISAAQEKKFLLLITLLYLITVSVSIWLHKLPVRDMAHRYIPMAEAFAAGDFRFAFHPRIPPLQPVSGGIVAFFTGADGFLALKIASALWAFAGGVLIYLLFRELYPRKRYIPVAGTLLYIFFPYMFHLAYSGLRESAKGSILILLALGLVKIRRNCRAPLGFLLTGIGAGLAPLVRAEMLAVGTFCLFVAGVFECSGSKLPWRTAAASAIAAALCFPSILANSVFYHAAMPDVRFAQLFLRATGRNAELGDALRLGAALLLLVLIAAWIAARLRRYVNVGFLWGAAFGGTAVLTVITALTGSGHEEPGYLRDFLEILIKSFYYYIVPLALLHVAVLIRRKRLRGEEHAVLLVFAANLLLCTLQGQLFHRTLSLSPRYLFPATPLLLVFFLFGVRDIYIRLRLAVSRRFADWVLWAALFGLAVMYIVHAPQPLVYEYTSARQRAERKTIRETAELIARDYRGPENTEPRRILWNYCSRRRPKVWFDNGSKLTIAAYLAGGSITKHLREADYAISSRRKRGRAIGRVKDKRRTCVIWRLR